MSNMKNNNDESNENDDGDGENSSGLSSLLSKFSLTKLRSQKWAKPISRLSFLILIPNIYLFHLFRFSKHLSPSPLIRVLKVTSGLADAAGWFYQTPCHLVTMSPCHLVTLSPCHLFTLSHFTAGELGFSRHFPPPQPLVLFQERLACLSPLFLGSPVGRFMISALLAISSCRW